MSRHLMENRGPPGFFHRIFAWGRQISDRSGIGHPAGAISAALVKLVGDDRVLDQKLERNDLESILMRGLENDRAGGAGLLHLEPAGGTDAPAVAGFQAREAELGHGGAEIISERLRGREERRVDNAADSVDAVVFNAGLTAARAVKTCHGL